MQPQDVSQQDFPIAQDFSFLTSYRVHRRVTSATFKVTWTVVWPSQTARHQHWQSPLSDSMQQELEATEEQASSLKSTQVKVQQHIRKQSQWRIKVRSILRRIHLASLRRKLEVTSTRSINRYPHLISNKHKSWLRAIIMVPVQSQEI